MSHVHTSHGLRLGGFSGKTALVTGAGQGVGKQIALDLAAAGVAAVVVNDYVAQRANVVAEQIRQDYGTVQALAAPADVTDWAQICEMAKAIHRQVGPIDILINNAGNAGATIDALDSRLPFAETTPKHWQPWLDVNLYGPLHCTRAVLPDMIDRQYGRVVTIISDAGRTGEAGVAVYSAAKAGAAGFTRALAKEVGKYNITVNNVSLAAIRTDAIAKLMENPDAVRKVLSSYPLRRFGEPADAAAMVLFLVSAEASWITGQTYPVNGGYSFAL